MQCSAKTKAASHAQSQTQFFEFDLSLTKIQFAKLIPQAGAHVQSQTQFLSLT